MKKNLWKYTLFLSLGIFLIALTQKCYCTTAQCGDSLAAFIVGIIGVFFGGAALTWLANPLLLFSWITVKLKPTLSLIAALLATFVALSFLFFDEIIDNEGGTYNEIIEYKLGYWLWVSSSVVMFIGQLIIKLTSKK